MLTQTIGFIGGGNMTRSLVGGLVAKNMTRQQIIVADRNDNKLQSFANDFGIQVTADLHDVAVRSDVLVLSVKPQQMRVVVEALAPTLATRKPLLLSVAAGLRSTDLARWAGLPVIRTMPNRPALNGCGVTGLYADAQITASQRALAETIMNAVGKTVWVETEPMLDALTAVSGSGPAYFFLLMELLEAAGIEQGLPADVARTLAIETAYGAGVMARDATESPGTLREQVTSKGGTTAAALQVFNERGLKAIVSDAVTAATKRSAELAEMLSKA